MPARSEACLIRSIVTLALGDVEFRYFVRAGHVFAALCSEKLAFCGDRAYIRLAPDYVRAASVLDLPCEVFNGGDCQFLSVYAFYPPSEDVTNPRRRRISTWSRSLRSWLPLKSAPLLS